MGGTSWEIARCQDRAGDGLSVQKWNVTEIESRNGPTQRFPGAGIHDVSYRRQVTKREKRRTSIEADSVTKFFDGNTLHETVYTIGVHVKKGRPQLTLETTPEGFGRVDSVRQQPSKKQKRRSQDDDDAQS